MLVAGLVLTELCDLAWICVLGVPNSCQECGARIGFKILPTPEGAGLKMALH